MNEPRTIAETDARANEQEERRFEMKVQAIRPLLVAGLECRNSVEKWQMAWHACDTAKFGGMETAAGILYAKEQTILSIFFSFFFSLLFHAVV